MNKSVRKRLAVAFTGPSNSGKTSLIIKIAEILTSQNFSVKIIKHDPADKAIFDKEGKDSHKFYQTGCDVAVVSPTRTTIFKHRNSTIEEISSMFDDFDYLLVEGLKTLPLPRIAVFRNKINESYLDVTDVLATDDTISTIPKGIETLDLNNPIEIINWINTNAKRV